MCFVSHLFLLLAALNTPYVQIHICLSAEIMRFCGQLLSSPPCFIMQIPPCLRRHTLANVLCCFIIYRGFTQLSIFRLSRHCTTLHLYVCLPGELWVMQCCEHCATAEDKCFLPNPDKASKCRQKLPLDWRFLSSLCSLLADV